MNKDKRRFLKIPYAKRTLYIRYFRDLSVLFIWNLRNFQLALKSPISSFSRKLQLTEITVCNNADRHQKVNKILYFYFLFSKEDRRNHFLTEFFWNRDFDRFTLSFTFWTPLNPKITLRIWLVCVSHQHNQGVEVSYILNTNIFMQLFLMT